MSNANDIKRLTKELETANRAHARAAAERDLAIAKAESAYARTVLLAYRLERAKDAAEIETTV